MGLFLLDFDDVAHEVVGRSHFDADFHQVVACIDFVVAREPALPAGHEANLLHAVLRLCVKPLQACVQKPLAVARMDVVGKEDAVTPVVANPLHHTMLSFVGRDETIEVACGRTADGRAQMTVADRGASIPEALRCRLFERFYQMPSESAASGQGLGLGLNIVAGFVRGMGGTVNVDARTGGGNVFTVELPGGEAPGKGGTGHG